MFFLISEREIPVDVIDWIEAEEDQLQNIQIHRRVDRMTGREYVPIHRGMSPKGIYYHLKADWHTYVCQGADTDRVVIPANGAVRLYEFGNAATPTKVMWIPPNNDCSGGETGFALMR